MSKLTPHEAREVVLEALKRGKLGELYVPHKPTKKQLEFLSLTNFEALYGGAAGGGKSDALLMGAAQFLHVPHFSALLLRRTFKDLTLPGALLDRAREWFTGTDAKWNDKEKRWTFPSGANITFGYLQSEHDKYQYQSSEFQYIAFDEATQFSETQYTYLLTRLRRLKNVKVPLRSRCATNPGGTGHEWVKRRFVDKKTQKDREFIPALLEDNPFLDHKSYERSLEELDSVTYAQLRKGVWVRDTKGLVYKYNADVNSALELPPLQGWTYIHSVDLGTSEIKPTTAIIVLAFHKEHRKVYAVQSEKHAAMIPSDIAKRLKEITLEYSPERTIVDAGGLGAGYIGEFQTRHGIPCEAAEKRNKLGYRKLINGDLEKGRLIILERENTELIKEMDNLPWNLKGDDGEKGKDNHMTDALLYGWRAARHFLGTEPIDEPTIYTPEYYEKVAQELKEQHIENLKEKNLPWWKRRAKRGNLFGRRINQPY